jgi:hypothetical protein
MNITANISVLVPAVRVPMFSCFGSGRFWLRLIQIGNALFSELSASLGKLV